MTANHGPPLRNWLLGRLLTTLLNCLIAFLIILALFTLLGDELASLPLVVRALLLSGLLAVIMGNLVAPVVAETVVRKLRDH